MPVPEDRFTNSVDGAASYERYRAEMDDDRDYDAPRGPRRARRGVDYCGCHSASEEPCDYCQEPDEPDEEPDPSP